MKLIDPSQRINVLWDNDDGTRYPEEMTIRRLLSIMSDDEVEIIDITYCNECVWYDFPDCRNQNGMVVPSHNGYCKYGVRRADND